MNFKDVIEKLEFARSISQDMSLTRKSWNECGHIYVFDKKDGAISLIFAPHNIENFAIVFTPSVSDVCAEDWEEYTKSKLVLIS
jgi:hypothetical protein